MQIIVFSMISFGLKYIKTYLQQKYESIHTNLFTFVTSRIWAVQKTMSFFVFLLWFNLLE